MYEIEVLDEGLTSAELAFAMKYVETKDIQKSAEAAGYEGKSAYLVGVRMYRNPLVNKEIDRLRRDIGNRLGIDVIDIAREYANIAFFTIDEIYAEDGTLKPLSAMSNRAKAAITSIDVFEEYEGSGFSRRAIGSTKKIKIADKLIALDRLAKMMGVDGVTKILNANVTGDNENVIILPAKNT